MVPRGMEVGLGGGSGYPATHIGQRCAGDGRRRSVTRGRGTGNAMSGEEGQGHGEGARRRIPPPRASPGGTFGGPVCLQSGKSTLIND